MIRDKVNPEKDWSSYLIRQESRIERFHHLALQREQEEKEMGEATLSARVLHHMTALDAWAWLYNIAESKLYALYSSGAEIGTIADSFEVQLSILVTLKEVTYDTILLAVSMAVLLDCKPETVEKIDSFLQGLKYGAQGYCKSDDLQSGMDCNDMLLSFLMNYLREKTSGGSPSPDFSTDPMLQEERYGDLYKLLCFQRKEEQISLFRDYMQHKWYRASADAWWYDSHKSKEGIYVGYWAFECAAVAKVLHFSADEIANLPYFPMDLLHGDGNRTHS